ncbi:MAG: lipopolysaccharide biosynthesis protein [Marmoricola sp.]
MGTAERSRASRGHHRGGNRLFMVMLLVGSSLGVQALMTVNGIISARMLGVEGRGVVALVVAVATMTGRLTYAGGTRIAVADLLVRHRLRARDGLRDVAPAWALRALAPCALAAVYLAWLQRDSPPTVRWGLVITVVVISLQQMAAGLLSGCLQGEGAGAGRLAVAGLAPQLPFTVVLVVAFAAGWRWDAVDVLVAQSVAPLAGLYVGWRLLRPPTGTARSLTRREIWPVTRANYVNAVGTIDSIGLDRNLVGPLLGNAELGLYSAATAVANLSKILGTSTAVLVLPQMSAARDDPAAQRRVIRRWLPFSALVMAVVVVVVELLTGPLIRLAFGNPFAAAIPAAHWLVLADGLLGYRRVLVAVLQGQGRGAVASTLELVLTGAVALGIVVAAALHSLAAVGFAMFVVAVLSCLVLLYLVLRRSPQPVAS